MNNPSGFLDEKSSKNIDKTNVYSDIDGTFDCTLIKYTDNNQTILDEIQITIINESLKYSLLIHNKSNDESSIDVSDSNIELVKFHDLTGNYWRHRDQFNKIPGCYYLLSNDLDSSTWSEEKQIIINRINSFPKFFSNERAFINTKTKSIQETYSYIYDRSTCEIFLPEISNANQVKSTLLSIRHLILRIGVIYEKDSGTLMTFGSGCLINNNLVLTCAHIFDPILWNTNKISYSKILVGFCDPAPNKLFSLLNPNKLVFSAKILQRGLAQENIDKYTELKHTDTDLALLILDNEIPNITKDQYFNPRFDFVSSKPGDIPLNSNLYLVGYNGKLYGQNDLTPYRYLNDFKNLTIDKLNNSHHVNYKSVSIGSLIKEACENDPYSSHNCSTLSDSSGSIILDCYGRLAGIHIGVYNSRKQKNNDIIFTKETYNKYISINSNQFQTFIGEIILPNIKDDETKKKWLFYSK
ncbi:unnamed protein product [Rotaria sp. Silwood2]|nr:unnamed protein product [Rotaria sp. Silwood2]